MSSRKVDNWIETYLEYTENSEPPVLFRTWCAVSALAAALQRKCWLNWGLGMDVYPNMFIILVGPPATRKGTAMNPAETFIRNAGFPLAASATTKEALIRHLAESESQTTLADGRPYIHSSLSIFSKELTVLIGQSNYGLLSQLTDWFDCANVWNYHTKTAGKDEINNIWVNLIGATTPDLIRTALPMDAIGSGFTSRIVFVYEEKKAKNVPFPAVTQKELELQAKLAYDYEVISHLNGPFVVSQDFRNLWEEYYTTVEHEQIVPPAYERYFLGYVERRAIHALKLSMILNAARTDTMYIEGIDLINALTLLKRTEIKMPKTFSGLGKGRDSAVYDGMCALLSREKRMPYTALIEPFRLDLDYAALKATVNSIISMGLASIKGNIIEWSSKDESNP